MHKKVIFFVFCLLVIYQILIYKEIPTTYKDFMTVRKINKKLNEIVTPSELLSYYKQLKYLGEEDLLSNRKNDVKVIGIYTLLDEGVGYFSENNKYISDINVHFDKLSPLDKQKLNRINGKTIILFGKAEEQRSKGGGLLNLYVKKIKFVNK